MQYIERKEKKWKAMPEAMEIIFRNQNQMPKIRKKLLLVYKVRQSTTSIEYLAWA